MAVRVLLVLAVLLAFYGCGQSSPAPEQGEKEDVEKGVGKKPEDTPKPETTQAEAATVSCSDFPSSQHAYEYYDTKATEAEQKILDSDGDGWPCNEASVVGEEQAAPEQTGLQPTPEFYENECRMRTYAVEQGMASAESTAFANEIADALADDIEAGGDKDLGEVLDELGVPAYEDVC